MALDLNEYIKISYERPNRKVLEGLGASEGLIEYLMETPGNTNWNVVGSIINSKKAKDIGEIWFTGTISNYNNKDGVGAATLVVTDKGNFDALFTNPNDYIIFGNGTELSFDNGTPDYIRGWVNDSGSGVNDFYLMNEDGQKTIHVDTTYIELNDLVEISVKAK